MWWTAPAPRHRSAIAWSSVGTPHREEPSIEKISTIGLDLAKQVFQVHGIDQQGAVAVRKRLRRGAVMEFFARLAPCVVGIEALRQRALLGTRDCGGHDVNASQLRAARQEAAFDNVLREIASDQDKSSNAGLSGLPGALVIALQQHVNALNDEALVIVFKGDDPPSFSADRDQTAEQHYRSTA